jgi:exodeoxyribonuclease VII large subunit
MLQSLGYQSVLRRGFALVRDGDGKAIRQAATFVPGARIDIEVADGRVGATVDGTTDTGLATGRVAPRPAGTSRPRSDRLSRATPRRGGGGQGSLF